MLSKKITLLVLLATGLTYAAAGAIVAGEASAHHVLTPSMLKAERAQGNERNRTLSVPHYAEKSRPGERVAGAAA